jgi:hypothetical protein
MANESLTVMKLSMGITIFFSRRKLPQAELGMK